MNSMIPEFSDSLSKTGYSLGPFLCNDNNYSIYYIYDTANENAKYLLKIMNKNAFDMNDTSAVDSISLCDNKIGLVYLLSNNSLQEEGPDYFSYYNDNGKSENDCDDVDVKINERKKSCLIFKDAERIRTSSTSRGCKELIRTPMPCQTENITSKVDQEKLLVFKKKNIIRTPIPKSMEFSENSDDEDEDDDSNDEPLESSDENTSSDSDSDSDSSEDEEDDNDEDEKLPQIGIRKYDVENNETLDIEQSVRSVSIACQGQENQGVKSILSHCHEHPCVDVPKSGILTPPYTCSHMKPNEHITIQSPHIFIPHQQKMDNVLKTPIPKV
ncbi:hypothetical protein TPHA_0H00610 [Tetrapisispora phaffii CBS 4417]|uniref:Uncharacterized protein n=1 Tax=Tetrapisispora phaffii (strain ATCC 24235 / CBS 4417 / NBRC 1672 / NRRL Y-8282 / UCD 70-5) TaxID=1071381 RepID=G8BWW7_TETPH|nr:hypothetical protein TPHA_0H00610 [Tetrapisispora phaffii CBS 4417]CCE64271.1 hypothetical protein TPHA_0H00610 [Tetrapisispora phaffii CBS 4417]